MLTGVDDAACRWGLTASYRVPLAGIGERLDRFALHRVAESSVRNFLEDSEAALLDTLAKAGAGGGRGGL
jgi:hypothetical protein